MKRIEYSLRHAAIGVIFALAAAGCAAQTDDPESVSSSQSAESVATRCVDGAAVELGIDYNMETDPALLADILENDMYLADLPEVVEMLGAKLTTSQSLRPMFNLIRHGIVEKHPAVNEFLCSAVEKNLFPEVDAEGTQLIRRTIHHTFLLDAITKAMADDWVFMAAVREHLLSKRPEFGIRSDFWGSVEDIYRITGGVFEPAKTKTVDWAMDQFVKVRSRGTMTEADVAVRVNGLTVNILEATFTDYAHRFYDNSKTGVALAINPAKDVTIVPETRALQYDLSREWTSLYETWNLAFVTGNVDNLNLLFPKLLIPQVLCAEPEDYMFNRALSLWTSINFFLFAKATKPDVVLPNNTALSAEWGRINVEYARRYVRETNGHELHGLRDLWSIPGTGIRDQLARLQNAH